MKNWIRFACIVASAVGLLSAGNAAAHDRDGHDKDGHDKDRNMAPKFKVDASWPKTLPHNWVIGQTGGIAVDSQDHIWLLQRPRSIAARYLGPTQVPPRSTCCTAAPSVLEFDSAGNLIQAWGGPSDPGFLENRCTPARGCEWPGTEHGIFVAPDGYVYVAGSGAEDHQVLKFTRRGDFVMQIGKAGMRGASHPVTLAPNGTPLLGQPAEVDLDRDANELYIADGYGNRRIIVVNASTGAYKRHWGAYGNVPTDVAPPAYVPGETPPQQFRTPVHCVAVANDGLVYVCDRLSNRIQVFRKNGKFVKEFFTERATRGNGSAYNAGLSPDRAQKYLFNADGENQKIWTFLRETGQVVGTTGRGGRQAGELTATHSLAVDSKGNIYVGEVDTSMRVQKFTNLGNSPRD